MQTTKIPWTIDIEVRTDTFPSCLCAAWVELATTRDEASELALAHFTQRYRQAFGDRPYEVTRLIVRDPAAVADGECACGPECACGCNVQPPA